MRVHEFRRIQAEQDIPAAYRHRVTATAPAGAAPAPATAPATAPAPVPAWPFPVGVFDEEIQNSYDNTVTLAAGTKPFPDVQVEPQGWLRGLWFDFNMVAVNVTNVVASTEDFPDCAVNTVLLKGTNVPQTFGPFGGYDWKTINKYGGYQPCGDPRNDEGYSVTLGSASNGGSAHWVWYMPFEVSSHDALGDLQNQSDNSIYRVAVTAEALPVIFPTVAPSGATTIELTVEQDSYSEPATALALSGRPVQDAPPMPGTRQCWQQESDTGVPGSGAYTSKITNGIGYAYRNVIIKFQRAGTVGLLAGSTAGRGGGEADFPDPMEFWLGGTRVKRLKTAIWRAKMSRRYDYSAASQDSARGPEYGIRVLNWNQDIGLKPGDEARRKLFRTQDGNRFAFIGTWGHAGTVTSTSNYLIPRGGPTNNNQIVA